VLGEGADGLGLDLGGFNLAVADELGHLVLLEVSGSFLPEFFPPCVFPSLCCC
jgi:hypothetical protein